MKKSDTILILKYSLFAVITIGWLYDFYLFQEYDRFHTPNLRAWSCIDIQVIRVQLLVSTLLIIGYFAFDKIKLYLIVLSISVFMLLLYIQAVLLLNRFSYSSTCESDDRISDFMKITVFSLLVIYTLLRTHKLRRLANY